MTIYDIIKELDIRIGWSPMLGNCRIELNKELDGIIIDRDGYHRTMLNSDGTFIESGECLIFPSKANRNWNKALEEKRNQLLPFNTPVMVSDEGKC